MLDHIHVGDTVMVDNKADNAVLLAGGYEATVIAEDTHSFAVDIGYGAWWFYRNSGQSYIGDAVIIF